MGYSAEELREAVEWFDDQELSLSTVEEFKRRVLAVADRLEGEQELFSVRAEIEA